MPVNERAKASNGTMLSSLLTHWQNAESAETKRTAGVLYSQDQLGGELVESPLE